MKKTIRNAAKAIIVIYNHLLAIKLVDENGEWHMLPGGGQNHGETLEETLRRECKEEVSVDVPVGRLRFIREYRAWNHEFWESEGEQHQIEFMFDCTILGDQEPKMGSTPDVEQIDISWLPIHRTQEYRLFPKALSKHLVAADDGLPRYWGDVNLAAMFK